MASYNSLAEKGARNGTCFDFCLTRNCLLVKNLHFENTKVAAKIFFILKKLRDKIEVSMQTKKIFSSHNFSLSEICNCRKIASVIDKSK